MADVFTNTYEPPAWLDEDFIEAALREGLRRGSLNVNTINIRPATNVGDNYLSQMFRASAVIESRRKGAEDLSVIIKSMPKGEEVQKFVNEMDCFTREGEMLLNVLPAMQKILDDIGEAKICAKLYYQQGEPDNIFVLEDLCQKGYVNPDRLACLDLDHCLLVAESFAAFHAASLVAIQKDPSIKEKCDNSYWQKQNEERILRFKDEGVIALLDCLENWKSLSPMYTEKLKKLEDSMHTKLYESVERDENELNVLNHGDPWTSNIMFKYSDGVPKNIVFVDFQLSSYRSPAYDLLYFIFTSPRNDVRLKHFDDILGAYHKKLVETCKKLNYPLKLSFDDLKKMVLRRLFFGFFVAIVILPFMIVPSKDVRDLNDYLNATERNTEGLINNEFFKEAIESMFPFFLEHGIFD